MELVTASDAGARQDRGRYTVVESQPEPHGAAYRPLHPDWRCEA